MTHSQLAICTHTQLADYSHDELRLASSLGFETSNFAEMLTDPKALTTEWMPYIAIGSGNSALVCGVLASELYRKRADIFARANTYFAIATFGQDEPTDDDLSIYEVALFDAASGGRMGERWVLDTAQAKDNIDEIYVQCAITFVW